MTPLILYFVLFARTLCALKQSALTIKCTIFTLRYAPSRNATLILSTDMHKASQYTNLVVANINFVRKITFLIAKTKRTFHLQNTTRLQTRYF